MLGFLVPHIGNAQSDADVADRAPRERPVDGTNFCENLDEAQERVLSKLDGRAVQARDKHTGQENNFDEKKTERLGDLATRRDGADQARSDKMDELRAKSETDEQNTAIDEFVSTVDSLIADRRSALDSSIDAFEEEVEDLKNQRTSEVDDFAKDFEAELVRVFDTADTACDKDDTGAEVRTALRSDIEAVRADFKAKKGDYTFRADFTAARDVRKAAFRAAKADFKSALEAAKADLRAAFEG